MTEGHYIEKPETIENKRSILIVDDHPVIRHALTQLIAQEQDLMICGEAWDEGGAWRIVCSHKPNLVIVDLSLKAGSGLILIKRVRKEFPDTGILVLSMHDEPYFVERAFRAGAWGYLTKQEASDRIVTAIRKVLNREIYSSVELSPILLKSLPNNPPREGQSMIGGLSDREVQIFQMIGVGMAIQEIADKLHLSTKTIETHQARIREELNLKSTRDLVQYAVRWFKNREGE